MMIQTQVSTSSGVAGSWPTRFPHLPPRDQEPHRRYRQAHVLAVDDSLVDRKVIETLLRISSCKVTVVDSASRALQFLGLLDRDRSSAVDHDDGLEEVDMIITDYCMPGMTGYELLEKIKKSSAFREVPVVIMSSENINARIDRCLEGGAEDYIVKPVKLSDVRRIKEDFLMKNNRSNKRMVMDSCDPSTSTTPSSSGPLSPSSASSTDSLVASTAVSDLPSHVESQPGQLSPTSSDQYLSLPPLIQPLPLEYSTPMPSFSPSSSLSLAPAQSSVNDYSPLTSSQSPPPDFLAS